MIDKNKADQELTKSTKALIGTDLIKAYVLIGMGFVGLIRTKKSANLIEKAWSNIGTVKVEKKFKEIDVTDKEGKLIDVLEGAFIGYELFADVRKVAVSI